MHCRALFRAAPAEHLHPLADLEILVVSEEMLDLLVRDLRQIGVLEHFLVATRETASPGRR